MVNPPPVIAINRWLLAHSQSWLVAIQGHPSRPRLPGPPLGRCAHSAVVPSRKICRADSFPNFGRSLRSPLEISRSCGKAHSQSIRFSILQEVSSGWWARATPLKNMSSSIGMIIPNIWENKKWQPNHQPVLIHIPQD